ncbi:hypothetical protein [Bacillus sp. 165]|uniref:hypothetical protein n=1 Tax=Bacillus sp. 165 TaxID=1529117 RepID=UPI001ADA03AE|nr:hypothetical protein [Bacillus sp. 165]MBO9128494.1 hypothetical protein [Bacillus sp. 165]
MNLNRKINKIKSLFLHTALFFLIVGYGTAGTYSYFTSEVKSTVSLQNATQDEIVEIETGEVQYDSSCKAVQSVSIKNIYSIDVPITIDGTKYTLTPGQQISHEQVLSDNCESFGEKMYHIVGFKGYFDHMVTANVDQEKLNPTVSEGTENTSNVDQEPASSKAQSDVELGKSENTGLTEEKNIGAASENSQAELDKE